MGSMGQNPRLLFAWSQTHWLCFNLLQKKIIQTLLENNQTRRQLHPAEQGKEGVLYQVKRQRVRLSSHREAVCLRTR